MSAPVLRVGLVGCGRLAEFGYLPAVASLGDVELVAVADPDEGRRRQIAAAAGASSYADAGSLLAAGEVDAVVLASPAATHVADAALAVGAGVPVLVEKPPAPDRAGAERLAALGPAVSVGFNRRYDPAIRTLRAELPTTGPVDLGLSIQYRSASWAAHTVRDDVLLDLGPHLVDLVRWLAGTEIHEVGTHVLRHERARVELVHERGTATIEVGDGRFHAEAVVARDDTGAVVARHHVGGPVAAVAGRVRGRNRPHPLVTSLAAQLVDFAAAVRGQTVPDLGTAADGVAAMAAVDAARASAAASHRSVALTDRESTPC